MAETPEKKVRLARTCYACPEAYDAYIGEEYVGYLRLRHGTFTVECGDDCIHETEVLGDGMFEPEERDFHLANAAWEIWRWKHGGGPQTVDFEVVAGIEVKR